MGGGVSVALWILAAGAVLLAVSSAQQALVARREASRVLDSLARLADGADRLADSWDRLAAIAADEAVGDGQVRAALAEHAFRGGDLARRAARIARGGVR